MNRPRILVIGNTALSAKLAGLVPTHVIVDELHQEEVMNKNKHNNYDKHHPLCSNGYNFGKHKRGATGAQQIEYIEAAKDKRARKAAKRAKEAGHAG